ncbi:hypothetical protein C5746_09390 [Streptomyces atratus]|uniref:Uncharacterized protein n=1 Tax=Streptomyces atratus TaxID=1893 RepID=A0A2Z5JA53_STRAR|nr:hypothetical protein C5746_09390 [Streptomyces atratus]
MFFGPGILAEARMPGPEALRSPTCRIRCRRADEPVQHLADLLAVLGEEPKRERRPQPRPGPCSPLTRPRPVLPRLTPEALGRLGVPAVRRGPGRTA